MTEHPASSKIKSQNLFKEVGVEELIDQIITIAEHIMDKHREEWKEVTFIGDENAKMIRRSGDKAKQHIIDCLKDLEQGQLNVYMREWVVCFIWSKTRQLPMSETAEGISCVVHALPRDPAFYCKE